MFTFCFLDFPLTTSAFPIATVLIHTFAPPPPPVVAATAANDADADFFAGIRTSILRFLSLTKNQKLSSNPPGFQPQIGTS